ncbi:MULTISPECIES: ABC transporter substrate-binding protein [unclassified Chelatococcus]|uniref:ABC transporter substrate-binding protein n=1 Tax=unclassified Chelatococcus TaxID=2638111 RepID=UPI001BCA692E|nr:MULTISPECIES: ABC transporter substrate-binding protein [unclassified Chelatococcus]MBS7699559.1 carbohydrate ABC transporter substrate-binding protein [Chelatococcus sp. YT9]MBX3560007.1 carbohydrate ABC transporter substrate-binding protein [Chelatococcus sp.]
MTKKNILTMTRRRMLGMTLAGAGLFAGRSAFAAAKTLNILSHKVHQTVLNGPATGDLTEAWRKANDAELSWVTFDSNPLQDRLFREASLPKTDFSVGYIIDNRPTAEIAKLFTPLDDYQSKAPIEDFSDIAPGLVQAMTVGGKMIGVPVRHATQGLFYNQALLEEKGIKAPAGSLEELVEQAKQLTFTTKSGTPVVGLVLASDLAVFPVMFARAYGGDFITSDFKLLPNPEAMEKGLSVLKDLFDAGALPRSYATTRNDDQVTWLQQGRAAYTVLPFARNAQLNNKDQSSFPGKIKAVEFPIAESLKGKTPMASVVESWGMVIPANASDKDLAWSFLREVASKRVTLGMAINGNGPVRVSTYAEKDFAAANPVAAVEAAVLKNARGAFPPFPEAARAQTIFLEEVQLAVLGRKPVKAAVADIASRVRPLLPA